MTHNHSVLVLAILTLATGCGDNPVKPSETTARPSALVIVGPDAVLTNSTGVFAPTATLPDGSTRTVEATWISSNPEIGSVDAAGRLAGHTHGSTTLNASYAGVSATKSVRVVNNYGGTWQGRNVVRTCTDSGDLTDHDGGWCANGPGRVGSAHEFTLLLVQSGSTLSGIDGTLGNASGPAVTGLVTGDGRLNLRGSWNVLDWEGETILGSERIQDWDTTLTARDAMTGRWSQDYESVYFRIGRAQMQYEIAMTRSTDDPWGYVAHQVGRGPSPDPND